MARRTQVVRLSRKEILEQRGRQLRGECIAMAASLSSPSESRIDDVIRGAERIFAWMATGKLPEKANIEALSSEGRAEMQRTGVRPLTTGL